MILVNESNVVVINAPMIEALNDLTYKVNNSYNVCEPNATIYKVELPYDMKVNQCTYIDGVFTSTIIPPAPVEDEPVVEEPVGTPVDERKRALKLKEISNACTETIFAGIDIGDRHLSLTTNDQINIANCYNSIVMGAPFTLYHMDDELCEIIDAEHMKEIYMAAVSFKTYHITYCNHINIWINRVTTQEELDKIYYGCQLPEDLATHLNGIMEQASQLTL